MTRITRILAYMFGYIVVPVVCLEFVAELRLDGLLATSNSPISWLAKPFVSSSKHIDWLNRPLVKQSHYYKDLYLGSNEYNPVIFETDSYGSSIENSLESFSNRVDKVLFCGGSTSESASIPAEYRPIYISSIKGGQASEQLPYINLSKSGNTLHDCIEILKSNQIKNSPVPPSKVVIATNVNTLGAAVVSLASGLDDLDTARSIILDQYHDKSYIRTIKKLMERNLPGLAEFYRRIYRKEFNKANIGINQPHPHEVALISGCCHISALVNNRKDLSWDWESKDSLRLWDSLVKRYFNELAKVVDDLGVERGSVFIFIEPNSFNLIQKRERNASFTNNQRLSPMEGVRYSGNDSYRITLMYDGVYADNAQSVGFRIIESPYKKLRAEHFFDAVHLTPSGGALIGKYLYESLN